MTYAVEDLAQVLAPHIGTTRRIRRIDRRPCPYQSSFFVDEIDVTLDDGTALALIAKAADGDAIAPEAKRAKPSFLRNDARERATYESILPHLGLNTPRFLGSYVDGAGIPFLLLERIDGIPLWQCGEFEAWREAARWLARLHAGNGTRFADSSGAAAHLIRYDRAYYDRWMQRACEFHETPHRDLDLLALRHSSVADWLLAESTAFIHGEFYPPTSSSRAAMRRAPGRSADRLGDSGAGPGAGGSRLSAGGAMDGRGTRGRGGRLLRGASRGW